MKKNEFNAQSGKSLIEMLIILAVGGILVAMAVTRMTSAQANMERQNLAREFKVNLERARFDAVKRRAVSLTDMTRIMVTSPTSYKVWLDLNQNGALETSEERAISFADRSDVKIFVAGVDLTETAVTIRFDRFGNTTTVINDGSIVSPVFTFCEGVCTLETATVVNSNIISLSSTGTVAMLNGGETLPTFEDPTVTDVNTGTSINKWVVIRDDDATLPIPTGTPGPFPTSSPTPTPTPTESPTATPTPTPNVVYCTSGQKPSVTGCTCKLPMTVRQNGKCQ